MNRSKYSAQPEQCHRTRTKSYKKMLHSMPAQRMKKTYSKFNDTSNDALNGPAKIELPEHTKLSIHYCAIAAPQ